MSDALVNSFLNWENENRKARGGITPSTEKSYRDALNVFRGWLKTNSLTIFTVEKKGMIKFRDFLEENFKGATPKHRIGIVKRFFKWMELEGKIEFSPVPELLTSGGSRGKPHLVPIPNEIFRIRSQAGPVRVDRAMAFEMLLSTGMRADEFKQIRVCDIEFDKRPTDLELHRKSPFFVGSIYLDEDKVDIKNNLSRRVWINRIAMRLLITWMRKNGIKPSHDVPLFVLSDSAFSKWFRETGAVVYGDPIKEAADAVKEGKKVTIEKFDERFRDLSDINLNSMLDVSEKIRKKIEKKQQKEAAKSISKEKKKEKRKNIVLHPHALRHSFTCINYYRNPYGEKRQSDRLRTLLGHTAFRTTFTYLKDLDLVEDDKTWVRLQIGRQEDWGNLK